jgi:hypothetical protein
MSNTVEDVHNEELHGEMIYIYKDNVDGSIGESRSDSMSKERSEKTIAKGNEEVSSEENFEQKKEDYNQGNACVNDHVIHDHGVRGINSNIVGRC